MANSTFRFELFLPRINKTGKAPIRLIYQISGVRKFIPTGQKVFPENWDKKNQRAVYLDKRTAKRLLPNTDFALLPLSNEVNDINNKLNSVIDDIKAIEKRFELDKITYSPDMVINAYNESKTPETKKDQSKTIVYEYIDRFIEEQSTTLTKGSLTVYRSLKKHLVDFHKKTKMPIRFDNMDLTFFKSFQNFLIKEPVYGIRHGKEMLLASGLKNTTVAKQLTTLKTLLRYAERTGIATNNKYRDFTVKREALPVIALTQSEFSKMFFFDFSDYTKQVEGSGIIDEKISYQTLEKVRDIFCFACVTGLRFSDLSELNWSNIKNNAIDITVVKTKQKLHIPLNEYALSILGRYRDKATPLPRMTNQRLNVYLKVLGKFAGIDENVEIVRFKGATRVVENYPKYELIGAHTGRKTFCTLSLEKGMSAEQVMAISGHKDYKSFKRYVNVTNEIKKQAIVKAWEMPKVLSIAK